MHACLRAVWQQPRLAQLHEPLPQAPPLQLRQHARCRLPFAHAQQLEAESSSALLLVSTLVVKCKANMLDAPYLVEKGSASAWRFALTYASVDAFLPLAHKCLAASRLPYGERDEALKAGAPGLAPQPGPCLLRRTPTRRTC